MLSATITILAFLFFRKLKHFLSVLVPPYCCGPYNSVQYKYVILSWIGSFHIAACSLLASLWSNL